MNFLAPGRKIGQYPDPLDHSKADFYVSTSCQSPCCQSHILKTFGEQRTLKRSKNIWCLRRQSHFSQFGRPPRGQGFMRAKRGRRVVQNPLSEEGAGGLGPRDHDPAPGTGHYASERRDGWPQTPFPEGGGLRPHPPCHLGKKILWPEAPNFFCLQRAFCSNFQIFVSKRGGVWTPQTLGGDPRLLPPPCTFFCLHKALPGTLPPGTWIKS